MATPLASENFIKTLQALQCVCQKAVHSVEKAVYTWHSCQKQSGDQRPCSQPQVCSTKGKPKSNGSCDECVEWGRTIEAVYYPQPAFVAWKNVNPTLIYGSAIEVCNAFALQLPAGQRPSKMSDYDTASILKIMLGFGEFHQNNQATVSYPDPYQTIQKVSDIRNSLSHYPMNENLYMSEQTLNEHFQDIKDFVQCLEELQHFTQQQGDEIRAELDEIRTSPATLTSEMEHVINDSMRKGLQEQADKMETSLADALEIILKEMIKWKADTNITRQAVKNTSLALGSVKKAMDESKQLAKETKQELIKWKADTNITRQAVKDTSLALGSVKKAMDESKQLAEETKQEIGVIKDHVVKQDSEATLGSVKKAMDESKQLATETKQEISVIKDHVVMQDSEAKLREETSKWRERLKAKYKQERRMIRFGRSRKDVADTDDIFVDLALLEEQEDDNDQNQDDIAQNQDDNDQNQDDIAQNQDDKAQNQDGDSNDKVSKFRKLNSYEDLLALEMKKGSAPRRAHHILLRGLAGCGKTTLLSRIACMWAADNVHLYSVQSGHDSSTSAISSSGQGESPWDRFQLVFMLEIRNIMSGDSLEQVIQKQLLPGVSVESIAKVVSMLGKKCLILLDGFDEMPKGIDDSALDSPLMCECFVIVTTRPHMVDEFCRGPGKSEYVHVQLSGFTLENSKRYIKKFYDKIGQSELAVTLIEKVEEIPVFQTLSSFPILLDMTCLLWKDARKKEKPFQTMTSLYQEAVVYLNKPFEEKYQVPSTQKTESILVQLGRPALEALFTNTLQIKYGLFDENILEQSAHIGLIIKEDGALLNETYISFIHKTFQEFCAAKHLVHLFQVERSAFHSYLNRITPLNLLDMEYLLRFSCGLSTPAAEAILQYVFHLVESNSNWIFSILLLCEAVISSPSKESAKLCTVLDLLHGRDLNINTAEGMLALSNLALLELNSTRLWLQQLKTVVIRNCKISGSSIFRGLSCITFLQFLTLTAVDMTDDYAIGGFQKFIYLQNVHVSYCHLNTCAITSLLGCIPSQAFVEFSNVILSDVGISLCASDGKFKMTGAYKTLSTVRANFVVQLIGWMSSCTSVKLVWLELTGEVENNILQICQSIKELQVCGSCSTNAFFRLLYCMPSVRNIKLGDFWERGPHLNILGSPVLTNTWIDLKGNDDGRILPLCESIEAFQIRGSLTANTMMKLIGCMPSIKKLTLNEMDVVGNVDGNKIPVKLKGEVYRNILPTCKSLKEVQIGGSISANTMIKLLSCMPSVSRLHFLHITTVEKLSGIMPPLLSSLTEFKITGDSIHADLLLRLVSSSPLSILSLSHVQLIGTFDCSNLPVWGVKEFQIVGSFSIKKIMVLLRCMPSLAKVTLCKFFPSSKIDEDMSTVCNSVKEFKLLGLHGSVSRIGANILMTLLRCMPSVITVKLNRVEIVGDIDSKMLLSMKSIRNFALGGSVRAIALIQLLNCMPSVKVVYLTSLKVQNKVGRVMSPPDEPLDKFEMAYSMNVSKFKHLLGYFSSGTILQLLMHGLTTIVNDSMLLLHKQVNEYQRNACPFPLTLTSNMLLGLLSSKPVSSVKLGGINLVNEFEGTQGSRVPIFQHVKHLHINGSLSFHMLVTLLRCMPLLETAKFQVMLGTHVTCSILPTCNILTDFQIENVGCAPDRIRSSQLFGLLRCMPSVARVKLSNLSISLMDEAFEDPLCKSLKIYEMKGTKRTLCTSSSSTMMRLLACMPSVLEIQLSFVKLTGEVDASVSPLCQLLKKFQMKGSLMSSHSMIKLLECMPSVEELKLDSIKLLGEVEESTQALCNSLEEFHIGGSCEDVSTLSANTMMKLLSCMPSVTAVILDCIKFTGEVNESISPTCESLRKFNMGGSCEDFCTISSNTLMVLLRCMQSVTEIKLYYVNVAGEVDENKSPSLKSLKKFLWQGSFGKYCAISANTFIRVLGCMSLVTSVKLEFVQLTGEIRGGLSASCKSLKEFNMTGSCGVLCSVNANVLIKLLLCMPQVETITLQVKIIGEVNQSLSPYLKLLKKFQMRGLMRVSTVMKLVDSMPSVTNWEIDAELTDTHETERMKLVLENNELFLGNIAMQSCKLKNSLMSPLSGGSVSAKTLFKLMLICLPLETITISDIDLVDDEEGAVSSYFGSIRQFEMGGSLSINTMMTILACLSSVTTVKFTPVHLIGDVDEHIPRTCESLTCELLTEFHLGCLHGHQLCSLSWNAMMMLLRCMPSLTILKLCQVALTGEVDYSITPVRVSLKELLIEGSLTADILMWLMKCMPSVLTVKLALYELEGEVDASFSPTCASLREFQILGSQKGVSCIVSANTIMKLLGSMPSLEMVTFEKVRVTGKVDFHTSLALGCLKNITISACNLTCEIQSLLISDQVMLKLLRWIRHQTQLSVEEMVQAFIALQSSSLEVLEMDDSTLPRNVDSLNSQVVKFLERQLPYLKELSLSNSHLTEVHCAQLFTLIQKACENVLDTTTSRPGMSNKCLPLQWLDVSSCKIGNILYTLTEASQYMCHLKGLVLRDCWLYEDNFKELDISLTNIKPEVLDVSGNENISCMFSSDSAYLSSLVVLKLANTGLTADSMRSLPLLKLSKLAEFDLSNNQIGSNGAKHLAMSLHGQSVRQFNQEADEANVLDQSFHCLPSLERLNLSGNGIGSAGASVLAMSFQHLPLLKELNLSGNKPISPYAVQDIFKQLVHLPHLNALGLDDIVLVRQECDQLPLLKATLHEIGWWNVRKQLRITNEVRLFTLDADQIKAVLQLVFYQTT